MSTDIVEPLAPEIIKYTTGLLIARNMVEAAREGPSLAELCQWTTGNLYTFLQNDWGFYWSAEKVKWI